MRWHRTQRLLLLCAATDRTFESSTVGDAPVLLGKCIHCNTRLIVALRAEHRSLSTATIEHIIPKTHGGDDAIENLAPACGRCNGAKGVHMDPRRWDDPGLRALIESLQSRRQSRMREIPKGITVPSLEETTTEVQAHTVNDLQKDLSSTQTSGRGRGKRRR